MSPGELGTQAPRSPCLSLYKQGRAARRGKAKTVTFKDGADRVALASPQLPGWSRYLASMAEGAKGSNSSSRGDDSCRAPARAGTTLLLEQPRKGDPRLDRLRLDLKPFLHFPSTPAPPRLPLRRELRPQGPSVPSAKSSATPKKLNVFLPSIEQPALADEPQKTLSSGKQRSGGGGGGGGKQRSKGAPVPALPPPPSTPPPPPPPPPPPQHQRLESEYYRARTLLLRKDYYEDRDIPSDPRKYPMTHGKRVLEMAGPIDHFRTYLETLRKDGRIRNKAIGTRVLVQLGERQQQQTKAMDRIPKVHYVKMLGLEKLLHLEIKPPLLKLSIMNRARMSNHDKK